MLLSTQAKLRTSRVFFFLTHPIQSIIKSFWLLLQNKHRLQLFLKISTATSFTQARPSSSAWMGLVVSYLPWSCPCSTSDYSQTTARMIMRMHKSDHVTALFKTLKWLPSSLREKPKSQGLMHPSMVWPRHLSDLASWLLSLTHWALEALVFSQFLEHGSSCQVQKHFIYGSCACQSLSSDILTAPSLIFCKSLFKCDLWGIFLIITFKILTLSAHLKLTALCCLFSQEQISSINIPCVL